MPKDPKKWAAKATENAHGQFAAKAKAAGMSTYAFAQKHKGDRNADGSKTLLAKQAQEAINLMNIAAHRHRRGKKK